MHFCSLEHESFEDLGLIAGWIQTRGHTLQVIRLYEGDALPNPHDFDAIIIMGGGMGVYDEQLYPWLVEEKTFLANAILQKKGLLGICLGAQLLSVVLGGTVTKNKHKEIGWFAVAPTSTPSRLFFDAPTPFIVFQWHGDTFSIPAGFSATFASPVCQNQAFESSDGKIIGLQFHIETDYSNIQRLIAGAPQDLMPGPHIQSVETLLGSILAKEERYALLCRTLDRWTECILTAT